MTGHGLLRRQVRKSYEEKRRRRRARGHQRPWRLKRMAMEAGEEAAPSVSGRGRDSRAGGAPRHEQDMERFMQVLLPDAPCASSCHPGQPFA